MRYLLILLFSYMIPGTLVTSGQYYDTGEDPASVKWLEIKTERFKVIYPSSYGSSGIDFARSLEEAYSKLTSIYPPKKIRIPVVIHSLTTQANGYVAWAPKRMEIYPTPDQNTIPLENNTQLALHEMTHVMQMESLNTGFSKGLSFLLGQQVIGATAVLLPQWFLEGEAVFSETALSASGRGRSPAFQKQIKAITIDRKSIYSYDKMVSGSFKNYIPNHYSLGYQMVAMSRIKYEPQLWNDAVNLSGKAPFLINPVNISLSRDAGITKKKLFIETFDTLKSIWTTESISNQSKSYESVTPEKGKKYINYYSPVSAGRNRVAAIKTSLTDPPQLVLINLPDKTEERLNTPGPLYPYCISAAQSLLIWVETHSDPRWANRDFSVIKLMDIRNKIIKQLTRGTRYMSAAISPDGAMIAATENTIENKNNLVIINVLTEKISMTVPVPDNKYLQRAQWSDDGRLITFITLAKDGEGIISYNTTDNSWKMLLEESTVDYQSSFLRNDSLFFVSSSSGIENLYVLTPEKKFFRLTNSRFGATDPLFVDGRIFFCDYTSSGNNICTISPRDEGLDNQVENKPGSYLIDNVSLPVQYENYKSGDYTPKPYKKFSHLFSFHSWMPFYANLEEIKSDPRAVKPGFSIMSQNQLSTLITTLGYEYSDNRHKFHTQITWKGWYPVFETRIDYGDKNHIYKPDQKVDDPVSINPSLIITNRISVPLTFTSGKFSQYINGSVTSATENYYMYVKEDSSYDNSQTEFSARFYFSNYHISAFRDIYPRWAQVFDLNYSYYPFDKNLYGSFFTLRTALYFPGIFRNNGIKIRFENDKQIGEKTLRWNRISLPRSYSNIASKDLRVFNVDYAMPLLYPDINLLSLVYLKRIRSTLFFDYANGTGNYHYRYENGSIVFDHYTEFTETFSSYGLELMADFNAFRLPYMVSAGIQAAWQKGFSNPFYQLLFNIDIFGFNIGRSRM